MEAGSRLPIATDSLRVQIASDLHLEFYDVLPPFEHFLTPAAEVLALLGDISALGHLRGRRNYEEFLGHCCRHYLHVLILVGNHEFYSDEVAQATCGEVLAYMRKLSSKYPKVMLLENEGVTMQGVRIVGTALWSAVPEEQTLAGAEHLGRAPFGIVEFCMNDYHLCYVADGDEECLRDLSGDQLDITPPPSPGGLKLPVRDRQPEGSSSSSKRRLQVAGTNAWHVQAVQHLQKEAREATELGRNLLVLTHHTPSFQGTSDPRYGNKTSGLSTAFSTDLEYMLQDPAMASIHTWCFGHTHYNSDQHRHGRRLVSNQLGYPERPSRGYRRDLVIEVPRQFGLLPQREGEASSEGPPSATPASPGVLARRWLRGIGASV